MPMYPYYLRDLNISGSIYQMTPEQGAFSVVEGSRNGDAFELVNTWRRVLTAEEAETLGDVFPVRIQFQLTDGDTQHYFRLTRSFGGGSIAGTSSPTLGAPGTFDFELSFSSPPSWAAGDSVNLEWWMRRASGHGGASASIFTDTRSWVDFPLAVNHEPYAGMDTITRFRVLPPPIAGAWSEWVEVETPSEGADEATQVSVVSSTSSTDVYEEGEPTHYVEHLNFSVEGSARIREWWGGSPKITSRISPFSRSTGTWYAHHQETIKRLGGAYYAVTVDTSQYRYRIFRLVGANWIPVTDSFSTYSGWNAQYEFDFFLDGPHFIFIEAGHLSGEQEERVVRRISYGGGPVDEPDVRLQIGGNVGWNGSTRTKFISDESGSWLYGVTRSGSNLLLRRNEYLGDGQWGPTTTVASTPQGDTSGALLNDVIHDGEGRIHFLCNSAATGTSAGDIFVVTVPAGGAPSSAVKSPNFWSKAREGMLSSDRVTTTNLVEVGGKVGIAVQSLNQPHLRTTRYLEADLADGLVFERTDLPIARPYYGESWNDPPYTNMRANNTQTQPETGGNVYDLQYASFTEKGFTISASSGSYEDVAHFTYTLTEGMVVHPLLNLAAYSLGTGGDLIQLILRLRRYSSAGVLLNSGSTWSWSPSPSGESSVGDAIHWGTTGQGDQVSLSAGDRIVLTVSARRVQEAGTATMDLALGGSFGLRFGYQRLDVEGDGDPDSRKSYLDRHARLYATRGDEPLLTYLAYEGVEGLPDDEEGNGYGMLRYASRVDGAWVDYGDARTLVPLWLHPRKENAHLASHWDATMNRLVMLAKHRQTQAQYRVKEFFPVELSSVAGVPHESVEVSASSSASATDVLAMSEQRAVQAEAFVAASDVMSFMTAEHRGLSAAASVTVVDGYHTSETVGLLTQASISVDEAATSVEAVEVHSAALVFVSVEIYAPAYEPPPPGPGPGGPRPPEPPSELHGRQRSAAARFG